MPLQVFSARITYGGPDRLDVTRGSGQGEALAFAPSRPLLTRALEGRAEAKLIRELGAAGGWGPDPTFDASAADDEAWEHYVPRYLAEMRVSAGLHPRAPAWGPFEEEASKRGVRPNRPAWSALLARERVVLVCYCTDPERCHRALLRERILPKLGAVDCGEIAVAVKHAQQQATGETP